MILRPKEIARLLCARAFAVALRARSRTCDPASGPILVVAPHPDDETLGCGSMIAAHAKVRQPVQVIFLTDGEGSHPAHPAISPAQLAHTRRAEALAALAALGLPDPAHATTFLRLPDGGLDRLSPAAAQAAVTALVDLIRLHRPGVIFTPYVLGGSTEHTAANRLTVTACTLAPGAVLLEYPVWAWWNAFRLRPRLRPGAGNLRMALGPHREAKLRALACHRTQTEPTSPWTEPVLPPALVLACGGSHEFFFRSRSELPFGEATAKAARVAG